MILTNYRNWQAYISYVPFALENQTHEIGVKDLDGASAPLYKTGGTSNTSFENYSLMQGLSARLGTGTTEPTASDVCLEEDITSSITNLNVTTNVQSSGSVISAVITITGQNLTSSEIVITELGIVRSMITGYGGGLIRKTVMLIRELLEQPLTVPSGEGFSLTFSWEEA